MHQIDVDKLSRLARIDITDEEKESLSKDLESILGYIKQIESLEVKETQKVADEHHNIFREDEVLNDSGSNTDAFVEEMPDSTDNYLKVKQIL
jgi:aspartyl-tRNA(Asn)/glutamyl-tRNA(Gln) amidotransferase subunit C